MNKRTRSVTTANSSESPEPLQSENTANSVQNSLFAERRTRSRTRKSLKARSSSRLALGGSASTDENEQLLNACKYDFVKGNAPAEREVVGDAVDAGVSFWRKRRTSFILGLLVGSILIYVSLLQSTKFKELALMEKVFGDISRFVPKDLLDNLTSVFPLTEEENPAHEFASRGLKAKHPVFIIPGIVSTNLESWGKGGCQDAYFRKKIWGDISMASSLVLDKDCWLQTLGLDFETGLDPNDGSRVRAIQGIDAATYFMPGYWVWAKIIEGLAIVGYDSNNLHLAAYDWRLSTANLERRDAYFSKLKANIELFRRVNGEKAVLISHSMGGTVLHYFMKWAESEKIHGKSKYERGWVDEHIHAIIDIAPTMLGVPKTIPCMLSGEMKDTAQLGWITASILERFLTREERSKIFRNWGGVSSMLPKGGNRIWGDEFDAPDHLFEEPPSDRSYGIILGFKNESISTELETSTNYTTETVFSLLVNHTGDYFKKRLDEEYSVGIKMNGLETPKFDHPKFWTNPLESALPNAPDMKHITIYGVGKYTERCYFYTCQDPLTNLTSDSLFIDTLVNKPNERLENGVQDVYGDGSVPLISLGFMSANGWRHNTKQQYGKIFNPHKVQVITREYQHDPLPLVQDPRGGSKTGEHVDILGNHFLMRDILTVATGSEGSDFGDIWVSKIREISDKVDLKEVNIKY